MVAIKMKDFYNRLKNNGKHSTVAQLIVIAHALYKNNCTYNKSCCKFIDKSAKINTVA